MEPCWTFCGKRHLAWLALLSNVVKITIISFLLSLTWMPKALAGGPCPPRCHCNDETKTGNCTYASLDIVPIQLNPELRHLDLSGNQIKGINKVFDFYRYLESLDLHNNMIPTLGSNNFRQQDNLLKLNLSRNSLSTVTKSSLHGLTKLQRLDISNNNISELEEQTFKYTSELEQLDLSGNALTSLPDGLLRNLHRIKWIDLSRNSLLESPASNLALVPSLERLDLSENLIQDLTGSSLPSQPALDQFSLANNVLRSISDDAFDKLPSLLSLDLSGNNLTQVPSNAFSKLSILTTLLLNKNPLGELKNFAFKNLFELKNLELNDCFISSVSSRAFADNVNLERISMDGNRDLNELPDRVLYAAGNLRWVSLRRCSLGSLQPTQFPVDGLSVLRVGGNPLVCNCSLHWLWIVLKAAEERRNSTSGSGGGLELDSSEIVCTDEEFGGKLLAQLPEGSLRCKLDPVYLSLSVIGCLAVSAAILALVARAKKARRLKRTLTYSANQGVVGRPELLVYVGQPGDEITDKSAESYNRRLIGIPGAESPDNNFYEVPRYQRPPQVGKLASDPYGTFYIQQQNLHQQHTQTEQEQEGIYAVADVTSLRGESAEVASLYRKKNVNRQNPSAPIIVPSDYEYGYDYDYDGAPTAATSNKPQVVFV